MGLDMYLSLRKNEYKSSIRNDVENLYPEELSSFENAIKKRNFVSIQTKTDYQIGYWRKANAIHNWFVNKCANGVDDCRPIILQDEEIEGLLKVINKVLDDHSLAPQLLPTQNGFFFGDTNYDAWYFNELEYTKDILELHRFF